MAAPADRNAIVTGAAQGIGRATALRLAKAGWRMALVDRVPQACSDLAQRIQSDGGQAIVVEADLETKAGVDAMMAHTLAAFGTVDVAVHNVGGTMWTKPFWEYADDEIEQEISRSLWPTLRCCRAVIPTMMKQRRGAIVNIGSVATRGIYRVPYSAAKGGVQAMTVCLAMELAEFGIRVNCVAPGAINANRVIPRNTTPPTEPEQAWRRDVIAQTLRDTPQARLGEADEVAAAVAFLASDDASYITGQVMYVAGGGIG